LLAILTPEEEERFLPDMVGLRQLAPGFRLLDPTGLGPVDFARELAATDPEVILACWATPPLPTEVPPRLRYVCYLAGSVRRLVTRAQLERGLLVTNWGNSISRIVAECALFHTISCL